MRPLYQHQHDAINRREWPGTRLVCVICGGDTERCEEDAIYAENEGPLCLGCHETRQRSEAALGRIHGEAERIRATLTQEKDGKGKS